MSETTWTAEQVAELERLRELQGDGWPKGAWWRWRGTCIFEMAKDGGGIDFLSYDGTVRRGTGKKCFPTTHYRLRDDFQPKAEPVVEYWEGGSGKIYKVVDGSTVSAALDGESTTCTSLSPINIDTGLYTKTTKAAFDAAATPQPEPEPPRYTIAEITEALGLFERQKAAGKGGAE